MQRSRRRTGSEYHLDVEMLWSEKAETLTLSFRASQTSTSFPSGQGPLQLLRLVFRCLILFHNSSRRRLTQIPANWLCVRSALQPDASDQV